MLHDTTISERLEEAARYLELARQIYEETREDIEAPRGLEWSIEHSIRQRLNRLKFDTDRVQSETARLHAWTERIEGRRRPAYEAAS